MGDPKKQHRKYEKPAHPWQKERLDEEKKLKREYGLKNKSEIWKARSFSKHISNNAKRIIRETDDKSQEESLAILKKAKRLALIPESGVLNDILSVTEEAILKRRLQTIVFNKGYARSIGQARQFIVHGHIMVGNSNITVPSYLVNKDEEEKITFKDKSSLSNEDHPERKVETEDAVADKEFIESTKKKEEERVQKAAVENKETEEKAKPATEDKKEEPEKEKVEEKAKPATEDKKEEPEKEKVEEKAKPATEDKKEEPEKEKVEEKAKPATEDKKEEPEKEKVEEKAKPATEDKKEEPEKEKVEEKAKPATEDKKEESTKSKSE
jgi:small subunit ribosomal protein S4